MNRLKGLTDYREELSVFLLLAVFGFFINRQIEIQGLYMDDLYLWSCYGEQSFREYVFPVGSTRFRFVFYLISYVILGLIGTHITWIVPINILLNVCIAYTVFVFARTWSKSRVVAFLAGILYLASRMSYYQIGQLYGLMESFALWTAIAVLYLLYRYVNKGQKSAFIWANFLYFILCFIHERYLVLLPLFLLALCLKREKQRKTWIWPAATFVLVMAIRLVTIGTLSPAGTAGTDVADTFSLSQSIRFALSQVAYVFGVNDGPDHLNGLNFLDSPHKIQLLILLSIGILCCFVLVFLVTLVRKSKEEQAVIWGNLSLFVVFILLCIGSSSVTIRVELRWVYVTYTAALLLLSYMVGVIRESGYHKLCLILMAGYTALILPCETFYRTQFPNLYLWPNQLRYNSLAEETYGTYGSEIFGKTIYIIGDSYEMSDFTARTFFKLFDPERKAQGLEVRFVDSMRDVPLVTQDMLVLTEDPANNRFQDITSFVRQLKLKPIEGYYSDGWMDQQAQLEVMAGQTGKIGLSCYYPDSLTGDETMRVTITRMNGEQEETVFDLTDSMEFVLQAEPYETVVLSVVYNFYAISATEQRGQFPMAMVVNISLY